MRRSSQSSLVRETPIADGVARYCLALVRATRPVADGGLPELLRHAADVNLPGLHAAKVQELQLAGNRDDELYKQLLVAQCNELSRVMPFLFERIDDETELLLPDNLLRTDSIVAKLVAGVPLKDLHAAATSDNLRGEAPELWWHVHGCQQWLLVRRDTLTHAVRDAVPALAALIPGAAKETGQSDLVSGAAQETATLGALEPAAAEADTAASSASYDTAPGALR
jgi:hypothetical protein